MKGVASSAGNGGSEFTALPLYRFVGLRTSWWAACSLLFRSLLLASSSRSASLSLSLSVVSRHGP